MKFSFVYGSGVLTLPAKVIDSLRTAGAAELKVLLQIAAHGGMETPPSTLASELAMDESALMEAISFWRGAGLLQIDTQSADRMAAQTEPQPVRAEPQASAVQVNSRTGKDGSRVTVVQSDEMPHYTAEEIERIFAANGEISGMMDECQNILGKLFSATEVNRLLALTEYYRLDAEYVVLLCYHCKKIGKASVPYVDRMARSLWQEGIVTADALEERLALLEQAADLGSCFRELSGAGKRSFTEKEMKFFTQWSKWQVTPELLRLAYEVAVDNTGSPSMPYINKVLSNWQEAGYRTPEEVIAAMEAYKQKKEAKAAGEAVGSFNTDEFFDAALARSLELHMKQTEPKN